MISIMTPLNETCDLSELNSYADEYYLGIADAQWFRETHDAVYYNTRGNHGGTANFHDPDQLREYLKVIRKTGKASYLTVNAHNLDRNHLKMVRRIIESFADLGGTGVICSELNGLVYAKEAGLKVVLSTNQALYNCRSIEYLAELYDIDRVVLSRDMTIQEIRSLRERLSMEIETFGMNFGCRFSNGQCLGTHNHPNGGLCSAINKVFWNYESPAGRELTTDDLYEADQNDWNYTQHFMVNACGLCGLYELDRIGINSFKIVGRELSGVQIARSVRKVYYARELALQAESEEAFLDAVRAEYQADCRFGCKWGYQCYYPEKYF